MEPDNNAQINTGDGPTVIEVPFRNLDVLYVANSDSNTVSVISTENNTKIKDIDVGKNPVYMNVDWARDTLYVSNYESGGISVIDPVANKVVSGITLNVNPFNSGHITCNHNIQPPINRYGYIYSHTECTAIPDSGFEFSSWIKNLDNKSTKTIKTSYSSTTLFDSFLNIFGIKSENINTKFNITEFGNFTANFRVAPPAIPTEYLIGLYTIVASSIIGWSIPSIIA